MDLLLGDPGYENSAGRRRIAILAAGIGVFAALLALASLDASGKSARADRDARR